MSCPKCGHGRGQDHQRCLLQALMDLEIIEDLQASAERPALPKGLTEQLKGAVDKYHAGIGARRPAI